MSSIKFDSKTSAHDVLNMTMQWGYKPPSQSAAKKTEPIIRESEALSAAFRVLNPVINFVLLMAGAATAFAILLCSAWMGGLF